jgi:RNA polymerase sigma-70 factor (ECF subfamily)
MAWTHGNFRPSRACTFSRATPVTPALPLLGVRERGHESRPAMEPELPLPVLEACCRGDAGALREFVVRYERLVFAFLSRTLGAGPRVEDLAQETFLRALRAFPRFDASNPARPSTWLLTIASRLVQDERRRNRHGALPVEREFESHDAQSPTTPETERSRSELGRAIARAVDELPGEQRDAFVLAEFHGLEMKEIARVLAIAEGTAKTRLFRARERLRELLKTVWEGP